MTPERAARWRALGHSAADAERLEAAGVRIDDAERRARMSTRHHAARIYRADAPSRSSAWPLLLLLSAWGLRRGA